MANIVLAFLEQREGKLKKSALEVASTAAKLAKDFSTTAEGIVIGDKIDNLQDATKFGLTKITHFNHAELLNYSSTAYTDLVENFAKEVSASIIVFSNTALGKDLAPRVSVRLSAGTLMDCTALKNDSGTLIATRPLYAGKALMDIKSNTEVTVVTIRPNVFKAESFDGSQSEVVTISADSLNLKTKVIEFKKAEGKMDVAEADIIVSGGRGLKGPENFHLIEELAEVLGGAVGASRAAVDAGWRPHREQVGQTGKTVSPSLYIAVGISGAIQHLAGMSSSKYIVAINKDKEAPIFSVTDYGIAGDLFEVVPKLIEEIKKLKS